MPLPVIQEGSTPSSQHFIIAVASGKGGVGKSSTTVNLALALQSQGYQVGIMDADLYGPSIRQMLPEDQPPKQGKGIIEPAWSMGIRVVSLAHFRKENLAAAVRAPIANGIISQFIREVNWGPLDVLLIDFPPGTGDVQITLSQQANLFGAIMVTTPQELALLDVRKAANLFHRMQIPVVGVVENMSYLSQQGKKLPIFGEGGGRRFSEEIGVPLLAEIPLDPHLSLAADRGASIFEDLEETDLEVAHIYFSLAKTFMRALSSLEDSKRGKSDRFSLEWKEMDKDATEPLSRPFFSSKKADNPPIRSIEQRDNHTFTIAWGDGEVIDYRLSELQKRCPCAECVDEKTGTPEIDANVKAHKIQSVGRYGIRIHYNKGCSHGIYSLETLRYPND